MGTLPETLCRGFPAEFVTYLNYCKSLRFEDRPDHPFLRRTLKDLFFREGHQLDNVFDWTTLNYNNTMVHPAIQSEKHMQQFVAQENQEAEQMAASNQQ